MRNPGEQILLQAELENQERAFQEARIGTLQELEELKMICYTEVERTQRLRVDEPDKNSKKVNQFTVQIQEPQDKVNSLNDSRDFP